MLMHGRENMVNERSKIRENLLKVSGDNERYEQENGGLIKKLEEGWTASPC